MTKRRFAVYARLLDGPVRDGSPKLRLRARELLEQALAQCVEPYLEEHDMRLYVVGEIAILSSPRFTTLLSPIADLFARFLDLSANESDPSLRLWLRAGVASGIALESDRLTNGSRIRTIPCLDTSLPIAMEMESLRKGSRIFIHKNIKDRELSAYTDRIYTWKHITGHGKFASNITEYYWPGVAYQNQNQLADLTRKTYESWQSALSEREWSKDMYFRDILNLDETLKMLIRTISMCYPPDFKRMLLHEMLPTGESVHRNVRYEWGIWFQIIRALTEDIEPGTIHATEIVTAFEPIRRILQEADFLQNFTRELAFPDYARFQSAYDTILS